MSEIKSDVLIIGAGPSGIFTALELIRKNSDKPSPSSNREETSTDDTARKTKRASA